MYIYIIVKDVTPGCSGNYRNPLNVKREKVSAFFHTLVLPFHGVEVILNLWITHIVVTNFFLKTYTIREFETKLRLTGSLEIISYPWEKFAKGIHCQLILFVEIRRVSVSLVGLIVGSRKSLGSLLLSKKNVCY